MATTHRVGIVDYSRQEDMSNALGIGEDLEDIRIQETIAIVGCGGVGFWVALFAGMLGFQSFILFDDDEVDSSNLNRLPLTQKWKGKNKVTALKALIRSMRPDTHITTISRRFNPDVDFEILRNMGDYRGNDIRLFDCTDNAIVQRKIYKKSKEYSTIRYVKLGYEGFDIGAYSQYDVWIRNEEQYEAGYRTSSANAISSAMSAGFGLLYAFIGKQDDFNVNLLNMVNKGDHNVESKRAE